MGTWLLSQINGTEMGFTLLTPVPTRMAVCGGLIVVGGLPVPGTRDPRLIGLLDGGRWLAIIRSRWLARNKW